MHGFDRPAAFDELVGEKIEQLGMSRLLAHDAEVIDAADNAFAKMMLPDTVDHDAGEEGIRLAEHALGKSEAAGAFLRRRLIRPRNSFEEAAVDFIPGSFVVAADEDALIDAGAVGGGEDTHRGRNF